MILNSDITSPFTEEMPVIVIMTIRETLEIPRDLVLLSLSLTLTPYFPVGIELSKKFAYICSVALY